MTEARDAIGDVDWPALVASVAICELAGIVPGALTASDVAAWYPTLAKPALTPPGWVFGPVWTTLYALMGLSLYLVWRDTRGTAGSRRVLAPFALQLGLNAAWTLAFFGRRSILGGLVVILVLWPAILATILAFARVNRRAALLLVPYLAWVSFAAYLNLAIWRLNPA